VASLCAPAAVTKESLNLVVVHLADDCQESYELSLSGAKVANESMYEPAHHYYRLIHMIVLPCLVQLFAVALRLLPPIRQRVLE
jgi:hypothetical protein